MVAFIPVMTPPALNQAESEQLVSVTEAAARLDVSPRSLYRLIAQKELPLPLKVGRSSKFCASDLHHYVQKLKSKRI